MKEFIAGINWELFIRLIVAGALGTLVGLEREYRAKEAGYRTHFLVCLGSALMMIVSQYGFEAILTKYQGTGNLRLDPARIAAQVVSGIGFLGAGTILIQKQVIKGLTTAAGLWAMAGVGLAVGAGMYKAAIAGTVLILIGLELLRVFFKGIGYRTITIEIEVEDKDSLEQLQNLLAKPLYTVTAYNVSQTFSGYKIEAAVKMKSRTDEKELFRKLNQLNTLLMKKFE